MRPAIPDRWLNYKPIGERIRGTRFIAFKVPLRPAVNKNVDDENQRLDGSTLLQNVPNLGLIIDLTNTNRYYDPEFFVRERVEYQKLMIPGHVTPPDHLINIFKSYVTNFLESNRNNDKLIGVHCTHGVNRTGFLICNYMISEMTMMPKEAIKRFDDARGHNIERVNYLEALHALPEIGKPQCIQPPRMLAPVDTWRAYKGPMPAEPIITDRRDRFERCRAELTQTYDRHRNDIYYANNRSGNAEHRRQHSNCDNRSLHTRYNAANNSTQRYEPYKRNNNVLNNEDNTKRYRTSHSYNESSSKHNPVASTYRQHREQRERMEQLSRSNQR